MTECDLLEHIFERLCSSESAEAIFGADEVREWPDGALDVFTKGKLLRPAEPAQIIECDGCERNCFMPASIRAAESGRPACAFISCDKPEDVGRIAVAFSRLKQWQMTRATLAGAVARLLGVAESPQAEGVGDRWVLGLLKGKETNGVVSLAFENGVAIALAQHSIPLVHVLRFNKRELKADKDALLLMVDAEALEPNSGVGSAAWRKRTAKAAADARHDLPGGSRYKQNQIREIWASGHYTSRQVCAEEECAALGMSFDAARRALRNTPSPKRS